MTILANLSGWGSIFENVLLVIHVVVCLLLCLVVLMQRPKQEGLGAAFGGGMTDQAFGARTTDVLQKGTVYLASILFIVTLILSILVSSKSKAASVSKDMEKSGADTLEANVGPVNELLQQGDLPSAEDMVDLIKDAAGAGDTETTDKPADEGKEEGAGTPELDKPAVEDEPAKEPESADKPEPADEPTPAEPAAAEPTETPAEPGTPEQ